MKDFLEEIWDEVSDFGEDFWEHLTRNPREGKRTKVAIINGAKVVVRPAYLFAERVDNLLKFVFGLSLSISAFTATFFGFASLSQLVEVLINSILGRGIMFVIGISYLLTSFWRLLHLDKKVK